MVSVHKNLTVSEILRSGATDEPKKKSREDWRKAKELEEARKAGTAPAAVDEEGKDINPHIPQYIAASPWYYGSKGPTLKHQRIQPESIPKYSGIDEWYKKGVSETVATKYRPGACENCGAVTHKKKDCMERPRKIGAKFSSTDIAPDEFVQPVLNQSYDGKRDRWAGYDPSQHKTIVEQYQKIEEAKRQLRANKLDTGLDSKTDEEEDEDEDEDKYVDEVDMPGTKVDSKQRITVRNLRIREDTAKYLRNLDPDSAYYDPKTRSMRDNPHKGKDPEEVDYAGENFVRFTGDTRKHAAAQLFAWEAYEKGVDVHLLAEPTKLELLKQEFEGRKEEFKQHVQEKLLEKYGGEEHLNVPPKELLLAQTEEYREYSRSGKVIKGEEKQKIRSQYEEDVYIQNHTYVWGSYWQDGKWGYRCCHSFVKNSYCTGEAGKAAAAAVIDSKPPKDLKPNVAACNTIEEIASSESSSESSSSSTDDEKQKSKKRQKKNKKDKKKRKLKKRRQAEEEKKVIKGKQRELTEEELEKLKRELKREELNEKAGDEMTDDRKRPYHSMYEIKKPTEEEMEEYYAKRKRDMDPMADIL